MKSIIVKCRFEEQDTVGKVVFMISQTKNLAYSNILQVLYEYDSGAT